MIRSLYIAIVFLVSLNAANGYEIKVVDGDTITIYDAGYKRKIRLMGIDAPELSQKCIDSKQQSWSCGIAAKAFLEGLVVGREVVCITENIDRYQREVSVCYSDGLDVNQQLVKAGYAVSYRQYSLKYSLEEEEAKNSRRGVWKGSFESPDKYRKSLRARRSE